MTDTTATSHDVTSMDGRIFPLDDCRRVIRFLVGGVVIGLGTVAAAGALVATVTLAAAWIINTALATNPNFNAKAPLGSAAIALADHYPVLASAAVLVDAAGCHRFDPGFDRSGRCPDLRGEMGSYDVLGLPARGRRAARAAATGRTPEHRGFACAAAPGRTRAQRGFAAAHRTARATGRAAARGDRP